MIASAILAMLASPAPAVAQERIRFDANWKFYRDETEPASAGRGPFKWEFKFADVDKLAVDQLPEDLDKGDWQPTQLGINTLNGRTRRFAWYRTDIGAEPGGEAKSLEFESVDDNAEVFLNGKLLKRHIGFGIPFSVPVREAWKPQGPNRLVVLVENTAAGGGINGGIDLVLPRPETIPDMALTRFDDSKWRTVHLPHDYVVEGTFDPRGDVSHGCLPKPIGYYRKTFTVPTRYQGKSVWIDFDGVYRNATFYLNGEKIGTHPSGYIGVRYDLSKKLRYGKPNVLAVRTDPSKNEGWWYEGGGIYRHVWLNVANPIHLAPSGVFARSKVETDAMGRPTSAFATVSTEVANDSGEATDAMVRIKVTSPSGKVLATPIVRISVPANSSRIGKVGFTVDRPELWDLGSPRMYQVHCEVLSEGKVLHQQDAHFGIRDIKWDANRGFLLNGRVVKLQGTCNHQDHAGVGVAMPDGLQEWRIKKLLEMGSNAYRTSHNPTSPEFLDMCDRLGMLVLDETRHLGDTTLSKSPTGTTADDLSEFKFQVKRDRNHPSVIAWSLWNEEGLQGTNEGAEIYKKMRAAADELDGTRLCTGAANFGFNQGIQEVADLYGYNYSIGAYDDGHAKHPNQPLFGSETASTVSTRGIYANDTQKGYVSAYDVNAPSWGAIAETAWKAIADRPFMAGSFVWTGFDYKGEPTPYGWPCINSHFGIIDIAGFPKDLFYYYQSVWGTKPMVHVLPHWNWVGKEGQKVNVWAFSNGDSVELLLNGKSLGAKPVPHLGHVEWDVPYSPGKLEAVASKGGKVIARDVVETTGAPVALRVLSGGRKILADSEDLAVVQLQVIDAAGRVVPTASNEVKFKVEGAAAIGGVGNGDPSDHDPDKADHRKAFNGQCMVLVQSNGKKGAIKLTATAAGLKSVTVNLSARGGVKSE